MTYSYDTFPLSPTFLKTVHAETDGMILFTVDKSRVKSIHSIDKSGIFIF